MSCKNDKTADIHIAPKPASYAVDFCPHCQVRGPHKPGCPQIQTVLETHKSPIPEVSPKANFACVTLVFLEDWQAGRLTSDEVCETLLAAAIARGHVGGTVSHTKKTKPIEKIEIDHENHERLVGLCIDVSKNTTNVDSRTLADNINCIANDSELNVVIPFDAKNFYHMVETAQLILKRNNNDIDRELAELFLHFAKEKP
jgi:hypothetical protein